MKTLAALAAAAVLGTVPLATDAAPIDVGTTYAFVFDGPGSSIVGSADQFLTFCTNPDCAESPAGDSFEFTLAGAGTLTFLDLFLSIDQFEIFDATRGFLGQTSVPTEGGSCGSDFTCSLADPSYSRGIFDLDAGAYSISGAQLAGDNGSGAFVVSLAPIPLPASLPLMAIGLGGLIVLRRARRDA